MLLMQSQVMARKRELLKLLESRAGLVQLWNLYTKYQGEGSPGLPPGGQTLIETILDHEFASG